MRKFYLIMEILMLISHPYFGTLDVWQIVSAVFFLIAIIDPIGNVPLTIDMEKKGVIIHPFRVCIYSLVILAAFLLLGDMLLKVFGIQIEYFAIAGGFVIFLMALEMLLDVVIFKPTDLGQSGDLVPLAFPLYAGPGAFTALLSMTTNHSVINLLIASLLCMVILYIVLVGTHWLTKYFNIVSIYIVRKFFGVIVLGIAVQLMFDNFVHVLHPQKVETTVIEQVVEVSDGLVEADETVHD